MNTIDMTARLGIAGADFVATKEDVIADRMLTLTHRMYDRAQCKMTTKMREVMLDDALALIGLVRTMR